MYWNCSYNYFLNNFLHLVRLIKVSMDSSKRATIGLRSFKKDWLPVILFKAKMTSVCSLDNFAFFSPMLTVVLSLGKLWQM